MDTLDLVDDHSFTERVTMSSQPVLVFFTAPGCRICRLQARFLGSLATELKGTVRVVSCSIEDAPRAASEYRVEAVPNLTLFDAGRALDSHVGIWPLPSIREWMQALLRGSRSADLLVSPITLQSRRNRSRIFASAFFRPSTRWQAFKVASVVAPLLLVVNHGELLLSAPLSIDALRHFALNFLVPYLVSSYSTASTVTARTNTGLAESF